MTRQCEKNGFCSVIGHLAGALGQVQGFVELILPRVGIFEAKINFSHFVDGLIQTSFVKVTLLVAFCNYDV